MTDQEICDIVNKMSDSACYIAGLHNFAIVAQWKPILMVPANDAQEKVFHELLDLGLVHLDTERGQVGYRSSDRGRWISSFAKMAYDRETNRRYTINPKEEAVA